MGAELFAPALAGIATPSVWVPAPTTTACCALLAEIIAGGRRPGRGVQLRAAGRARSSGDALVSHPGVNAVGFIGSVATGASVATRAAGKTQLLELGGNGPMVVLEDADLGLAAEAALEAAYLCAKPELHRGRAVPGARRRSRRVRGPGGRGDQGPDPARGPVRPRHHHGPAEQPADRRQVRPARRHGGGGRGPVCCGGSIAARFPTALYAEPTVLDGVTLDMEIAREETFGPVVPVIEVSSAAEALELTNGLAVRPDGGGVHR